MSVESLIAAMPNTESQAQDWISWHKALKRELGAKSAEQIFIKAWQDRGAFGANTVELRNYLESEKIVIDRGPLEVLGDWGDNVGDFFGGVFGTFKTLLILAVVGVVLFGGVYLYKMAKE